MSFNINDEVIIKRYKDDMIGLYVKDKNLPWGFTHVVKIVDNKGNPFYDNGDIIDCKTQELHSKINMGLL